MFKRIYWIFIAGLAFFIILNMGIHVYRTNEFNKRVHTIDITDQEADYTFDFYRQNGNEISWKRTAMLGEESVDLYACSFEGVFTNKTEIEVSEWKLRLDITCDCYINSAWCGLMEIHQFEGEIERVQTLDLRSIDKSQVELTFYEDGDIIIFPLKKGDYMIYYPDAGAKELPIAAIGDEPGRVGIGIIMYWNQLNTFTVPDISIEYRLSKTYFQGTEATICVIASAIWLIILIIGITVRITRYFIKKKDEIEFSKKEIERKTTEKMLDEMIKALAYSIDAKDEYTHGHSERVAQYSLMLAKAINLSSTECKEIFYAGLVHDVGKIAIPKDIINKPGRLNDEEFNIIKSHPASGEKILRQIEDMPYLSVGAKYHHERYDGSGYPNHVKGEEIPLLARIIAVADAYDAMTSQRSYRNTLNQTVVKQEIWKGIGTQFDPLIAKHMIALIDADVDYRMREMTDETYEIINEIKTNEFWEDYDPKSIKSETKIMSDSDVKYFGEFIRTIDHWLDPKELAPVTGAGTHIRLTSKMKQEAAYIWCTPAIILYSSEDNSPVGREYAEYAVYMSAGYSWKTGATLFEEGILIRKAGFDSWNNWIERNKAGLEYNITARRENNMVFIKIENELIGLEGRVELPENCRETVCLALSGENCEITQLSVNN